MKITVLSLFFLPLFLFGQNPKYGCLNISSPSGESFFLYINSVKINETPQVKVRVEKMYKYSYDVKIEFADASHLTVNRNKLFICNKSGIFRDFNYDVVKENNVAKLVFKSMPAVMDIVSEKDVFVYNYDNSTSAPNLVESKNNDSIIESIEKSDDVKKTIKDELLKSKEIVEYLNKNLIITIKDTNNMIVDVERYEKRKEYFKKHHTLKGYQDKSEDSNTIKTSPPKPTVKTSPSKKINKNATQDSIKYIPPVIVNTTPVSELVLVEPENWQCNNGWPMHKSAFEKIRTEIGNETNDAQKLVKSKELVSKNCITSEQAFELTSLLKNDENKLDLSKFCFKYILDIKNYSILGKTFTEEKYKEMFYYFISH
jgi:hypothetical protein